MTENVIHFLGAILITYFLSRGFRRLIKVNQPIVRLAAPHLLTFVTILLLLLALRYPLFIFHKEQLVIYAVAQLIWVVFDAYRSGLAFRPPVVDPTESSATAPQATRQ